MGLFKAILGYLKIILSLFENIITPICKSLWAICKKQKKEWACLSNLKPIWK